MSENSEALFQWCKQVLSDQGWALDGEIVPLRCMPWSSVYQVPTSQGLLYLKQQTPPFQAELKVLEYLNHKSPDTVPIIIASDETLLSLLLKDAGTPLRPDLQQSYDARWPILGLEKYAKLQQQTISDIDTLIALGVPDWRVEKLPALYEQMLSWESLLLNDGLERSDLRRLRKMQGAFEQQCQQIMQYPIPNTLEHGDFHDNNVLCRDKQVVIGDWGDAVIAHPFFSLLTFLRSAARTHHLSRSDPVYQQLKNTYFTAWHQWADEQTCQAIYAHARVLNPVKFVASFQRISLCPGMQDLGEYQGAMSEALIHYLALIQP